MKTQSVLPKKEQLAHALRIAKAQDITTLSKAYEQIVKCGTDRYITSGVTITITDIDKTNSLIVEEVMIIGGLSVETIEAIKRDIKRSYDSRMLYINPKLKEDCTK